MSEALGELAGDKRRKRKLEVFMDAARMLLKVNASAFLEGALRELKLEYGPEEPSTVQVSNTHTHTRLSSPGMV